MPFHKSFIFAKFRENKTLREISEFILFVLNSLESSLEILICQYASGQNVENVATGRK